MKLRHLLPVLLMGHGACAEPAATTAAPVSPAVTIYAGPLAVTTATQAEFNFGCEGGACATQCAVDKREFAPCESPLKVADLKPGLHRFMVRVAGEQSGQAHPAEWAWKIESCWPPPPHVGGPPPLRTVKFGLGPPKRDLLPACTAAGASREPLRVTLPAPPFAKHGVLRPRVHARTAAECAAEREEPLETRWLVDGEPFAAGAVLPLAKLTAGQRVRARVNTRTWGWMTTPEVAADFRPNIVVIMTDDEPVGLSPLVPKLAEHLYDAGGVFTNAFVSFSLCCPSRATFFRGQYAHNHQVYWNLPPYGSEDAFFQRGGDRSTVATWLQGAGYRTALVGKYLNKYGERDPRYVPPGWSDWHAVLYDRPAEYTNFTISDNGDAVAYCRDGYHYLTDIEREAARAAIAASAGEAAPLFLYVAVAAPHMPYEPAARHRAIEVDAPLNAAFDEADVSDKPDWIKQLPPLDADAKAQAGEDQRNRVRMLYAVGDLVGAIVDDLEYWNALDDTYLIYTSDNGFHQGEHRLAPGKTYAYETDIRVPLVIRGPGIPAGAEFASQALNNDLAPTIADLAAVPPGHAVDGRSLRPLWEAGGFAWRKGFVVERFQPMPDGTLRSWWGAGYRGERYKLIRTGGATIPFLELYDLLSDPAELLNIAAGATVTTSRLLDHMQMLEGCAGADCVRLENVDPLAAP